MNLDTLLAAPADIELRITLIYVAMVLAGARILEALARVHYTWFYTIFIKKSDWPSTGLLRRAADSAG
jgi:hypothetical protein